MARSSTLSEDKLSDMRSHVAQLQQAYHSFQGTGSSAGGLSLTNSLGKLER